jgi:hypothetical protein
VIRAEWKEFDVSLEAVLEEREDQVLLEERLRGRGRESGVEVEMGLYAVYHFDTNGKVASRLAFANTDEALAALDRPPPQE